MTTVSNYAYLAHALKNQGGVTLFHDGKMEVVYADAEPKQAVIAAIQSDEFNYGLHIREYMPILLLGTSDFELDIFLNVYDLVAGKSRGELSNYKGDFTFSLVHASTYELMAQRSFCLCEWFIRHFKTALSEQRRQYRNYQEVIVAIEQQCIYLETKDMFASAKLYTDPVRMVSENSALLVTEP